MLHWNAPRLTSGPSPMMPLSDLIGIISALSVNVMPQNLSGRSEKSLCCSETGQSQYPGLYRLVIFQP